MSDNTFNFLSLWQSLSVQSAFENAHKETIVALDKARLIIEGELSTIFEYEKKFIKFQTDPECLASTPITLTDEEDYLIEQRNHLMRFADLVEAGTKAKLQLCSVYLIEAICAFKKSREMFKQKKKLIERAAFKSFDAAVVARFQTWRFDEIEKLRNQIQKKIQLKLDNRLVAHLKNRRSKLTEFETIKNIQQQITEMQLKILKHSFEAKKRIRVYDAAVFKKRETIKLLHKSLKLTQRDTNGLHNLSASIKAKIVKKGVCLCAIGLYVKTIMVTTIALNSRTFFMFILTAVLVGVLTKELQRANRGKELSPPSYMKRNDRSVDTLRDVSPISHPYWMFYVVSITPLKRFHAVDNNNRPSIADLLNQNFYS